MTLLSLLLLLAAGASSVSAPNGSWPAYTPLPGRSGWFASHGNHRFNVTMPRATLSVSGVAPVSATATWRRSDAGPLDKAVYIRAAGTDEPVPCSFVGTPTADSATFSFTPVVRSPPARPTRAGLQLHAGLSPAVFLCAGRRGGLPHLLHELHDL